MDQTISHYELRRHRPWAPKDVFGAHHKPNFSHMSKNNGHRPQFRLLLLCQPVARQIPNHCLEVPDILTPIVWRHPVGDWAVIWWRYGEH